MTIKKLHTFTVPKTVIKKVEEKTEEGVLTKEVKSVEDIGCFVKLPGRREIEQMRVIQSAEFGKAVAMGVQSRESMRTAILNQGGFAYAKARIDKAFSLRAAVGQDPLTGISIFADDGINGLKGDRLPGSPDYSGTFTLKYDTDLSESTKLGFNVCADFRGSTVNDLTPTNGFTLITKTPSFITFRAGANVDFDKFSLSLFVNNLLDKHVVYSKGVSNLFQQGLGGYGDTYYVGRPREVGLRLGYRF
jgi:hypothetical protein